MRSLSALLRAPRFALWVAALLIAAPLPAFAQSGEVVEYYGTDAVGSVRVVFDASGNIVGRMDYMPFGGELSGGTNLPDQRFAGLFRDGEAGLDYAQARSYQVRTGRFNAPDPVYAGMFDPQRWNRYSYTENNPIGLIDPEGLEARNPALCTSEIQKLNPNDFHCQPDYSSLPGAETSGTLMWGNNHVQLDWLKPAVEVIEAVDKLCVLCSPDGGPLEVKIAGVPSPGAAGAAVMAAAVALGRAGEQPVRAAYSIGEKVPFRNLAGRLRIPDGITTTRLSEVKNVRYQGLTSQLRDYAEFARETQRAFVLYVRGGENPTILAPELQRLIDLGPIIKQSIPFAPR
jgi:RHS repeat-associated protein